MRKNFSKVLILAGFVVAMQSCADKTLELTSLEGSSRSSGDASSIVLVDIEASNIFVAGSGGNETSDLTFEVRDDNGNPVDLDHQVRVRFRITAGPEGGEFLSPDPRNAPPRHG